MVSSRPNLSIIADNHNFLTRLRPYLVSHFDLRFFNHGLTLPHPAFYLPNKFLVYAQLFALMSTSDAAFFEWAGPFLHQATRLPKLCPIIARLHSYELYSWAPLINWDKVDRIVLVSNAMRYKFVQSFPATVARTVVVNYGVDLNRFKPAPRTFKGRIGTLAYLKPIKRIYELILAFAELRKTHDNLSLHIGGARMSGTGQERYAVAMESLVRKLSLQEVVFFEGHIDDPASWFQTIDIFVSNSFWEGQQNALLEAMASGCYCLSHFWDGAEEVLPQQFIFGDNIELADKIAAFCTLTESQRLERRCQMREIAETRFDLEVQSRRFVAVLWDSLERTTR